MPNALFENSNFHYSKKCMLHLHILSSNTNFSVVYISMTDEISLGLGIGTVT